MPTEIYLSKENTKETQIVTAEEKLDTDTVVEEIKPEKEEDQLKYKIVKRPELLNETTPLWMKHPNECTREEYLEFYRKVFQDYKEPLFWIHLNMDYPFNLKGILYFPKLNTEYDNLEGTIKLYNNQVFIADNIKEVIPEFLLLLKGVIDCPDLPLNVSRSALQNDGFVKKISDYITKKVADKLSGMYKVERENYEKYWDDISPFIKFGCLKDEKFKEKMKDFIIFKNLDEKYITLPEYVKAANGDETADVVDADGNTVEAEVVEDKKEENTEDKEEKPTIIYYVTDLQQQSQYINMFKEAGKDALVLTHNIDQPFIQQLEQGDEKVRFQRIDAEVTEDFKEEVDEEALKAETDALTEIFKKALGKDNLNVRVEKLKNDSISSMITLSEESRRMQDMMKMYAMGGMDPNMFGGQETLVLNANNKLVNYIFKNKDGEHVDMICKQLYDLAMLSHKPLEAQAMTEFVTRSNEIMMLLAK